MLRLELVVRIVIIASLLLTSISPAVVFANPALHLAYQTGEPTATPTATETVSATDTPAPTVTETAAAPPTDTSTPTPTTQLPTETKTAPTTEPPPATGEVTATATLTAPIRLEATLEVNQAEHSGFQVYLPIIVKYDGPQAAFTANPILGPVPLAVTFVNSSPQATHHSWDFGDGMTSNVISPTHLYTQTGAYTVTLTVSDGIVTDTLTRPNYITPISLLTGQANPQANFAGTPLTGTASLTVTFVNSSTGASSYLWDFDDGTFGSTIVSPTHTYTQTGVYTITLTASDGVLTDTLTQTNYITVSEPVVADFSANPLTGTAPLTVTFSNRSTGATTFVWDFGTGATLTVISPTYTYAQPGVYTVSLRATGLGGSDTLTRTDYITVTEPIVAAFSATPLTGIVPLSVTFVNSSTGASSFVWGFSNSLTTTVVSPTHIYTQAGVYTVSLTASGPDDSQTLTKSNYITITAPIVVSVMDTSGQAEAGLPVYAFNGTIYTGISKTTNSTGVATFTLPLGDYRFRADKNGTQFWSGTANHCTVPGCTTVTMTLSGPALPPVAGFTAVPITGVVPLTVTFTNSSTGSIEQYHWNFSDGVTSTLTNPTHLYAAAGIYTVSLTVSGPAGSHTLTRTNYITAYAPVSADFSANPLIGSAPLTVTFLNSSTGATDYLWDFGNGATLTVISPTYTYTQAGVYTVTLTASGPGGSNILTHTNYISVYEPVVADFSATPLAGVIPLTVTFVNSSTNATDFLWDFGDNITSTVISPTHTFTQPGIYTVSLRVSGLGGSDTLTRTNYITVASSSGPLTVTATSPLSNGLIITPNEIISATFSRAINSNTVTTQTFTIRGQQTGVYTGIYTFLTDSTQFSTANTFKPGEEIVVNVSRGIQAVDGISLTPYAWQFRVAVMGGSGRFKDNGQNLGNANYNWTLALGDIDRDGDLDAFVGNGPLPNEVWLNNGNGVFSDSGQRLGNSYSEGVDIGDVDGDGDLDAFIANYSYPNEVWLNDGNGIFSDSGQTLGGLVTSMTADLGDLDGDGDLDAFVVNYDQPNEVWLNDGNGNFSDSGQSIDNSSYSEAVALGDLDRDGDLDTFIGNWAGTNKIWLNQDVLEISKIAPVTALVSNLITYTLTITNNSVVTATNLVITDTIPTAANYITGGTRIGDVVSWTASSLAPNEAISVTFTVTAATTITNSDYTVTADGGISAIGQMPVTTLVISRTWRLITTTISPPVVGEHAMAYDSARKWITVLLAMLCWFSFLVGHVLNNVRGFG
jgi:uncharacterized repeat protein (TIGR01451 family)